MSIFKRKQKQTEEPSLLDGDLPHAVPTATSSMTAAAAETQKKGFLSNWSAGSTRSSTPATGSPQTLPAPLQPTLVNSPRISTSSHTSIFERSVDNLAGIAPPAGNYSPSVLSSPLSPVSASNATFPADAQVPAAHQQLVIEQQIPTVLDASVEAIVSDTNLDRVEVVTAHLAQGGRPSTGSKSPPPSSADTGSGSGSGTPGGSSSRVATAGSTLASPPQLPNPWSEEENPLTNPEIDQMRRLSFVSYADLVQVEQSEEAARSRSGSLSGPSLAHRPVSPSPLGATAPASGNSMADAPLEQTLGQLSMANEPTSTLDATALRASTASGSSLAAARPRQRSIVTLGNVPASLDMQIRSSTMSDELLKPVVNASALEAENPWAV